MQKAILFIDSECVLCDRLSRYVAAIDTKDKLRIAPLGGSTYVNFSKNLFRKDNFTYVELYWNNQMYTGPHAILKTIEILGFPYTLLLIGKILPNKTLWKLYNYVAKNRYRWFGKKEHCEIGTPKIQKKLLP